jgi:hypothetical protein
MCRFMDTQRAVRPELPAQSKCNYTFLWLFSTHPYTSSLIPVVEGGEK